MRKHNFWPKQKQTEFTFMYIDQVVLETLSQYCLGNWRHSVYFWAKVSECNADLDTGRGFFLSIGVYVADFGSNLYLVYSKKYLILKKCNFLINLNLILQRKLNFKLHYFTYFFGRSKYDNLVVVFIILYI